MIIRSRAPLRISFAGGGTDGPPYPALRGGAVLSATINKYVYVSLSPRRTSRIRIHSLDYDTVVKYRCNERVRRGSELDLVRMTLHKLKVRTGADVFIHSDAPPGSGLGSSSTMAVAVTGLVRHWQRQSWTPYDVAQRAYRIEREDLGIKGGMQDQYAAAFGGFNYIEFHGDAVVVNPLRIQPDVLNELRYRLVLCYTGRTRLSANILSRQIQSVQDARPSVMAALDELKSLTLEMKSNLLRGRLNDFGTLLHETWLQKRRLDPAISNDTIETLYAKARAKGAMGGKLLGAGAGGYLLLFCAANRRHVIMQALVRAGGQVTDFDFEPQGVQTWTVAR